MCKSNCVQKRYCTTCFKCTRALNWMRTIMCNSKEYKQSWSYTTHKFVYWMSYKPFQNYNKKLTHLFQLLTNKCDFSVGFLKIINNKLSPSSPPSFLTSPPSFFLNDSTIIWKWYRSWIHNPSMIYLKLSFVKHQISKTKYQNSNQIKIPNLKSYKYIYPTMICDLRSVTSLSVQEKSKRKGSRRWTEEIAIITTTNNKNYQPNPITSRPTVNNYNWNIKDPISTTTQTTFKNKKEKTRSEIWFHLIY